MESRFFVFLLSLKTWLDTPLRRRAAVLCWLLLVPLLGWSMAGRAAEGDLFRSEPIIKPEVERRDIHTAKIDTEDFELGFFGGLYSTGDFGTNSVTGARLAFHINESLFVEAAAGSTKTDTTSVETFFPTVFSLVNDRTLTYYNISLGWNILPGESFVGKGWAFSSAYYFIAGAGNTRFDGETYFTVNGGMGLRFLVTDWMALHVDMRDHVFQHEILLKKKTVNNLEMTVGMTLFF